MIEMKGAYEVKPTRIATRMKKVGLVGFNVIHRSTGEVDEKKGWLTEPVKVDASEFIKVYNPAALVDLHPQGYKVFLYLLWNLKYDGSVEVNVHDAMMFAGVKTRKSIYNGLNDLIELDIIRRSAVDTFIVDPNIAGRGQRKLNQE